MAAVIVLHYPLAILIFGDVPLHVGGYLLLVVGSIALIMRRRFPIPVLIITGACLVAYQVLANPGGIPEFPVGAVAALPVLIALYTAVRAGHRWLGIATSAVLVVAVLWLDLTLVDEITTRDVIQSQVALAGWLIAAAVAGEVARQHAAYLEQVERRAIDAEQTREEVALRRATEERLRIARELHDSLTHHISLIKIQAGVAVHLARKRGEEVPETLLAIQDASREAVRELRSTLDVLRRDDEPASDGAHPGLDRLAELVERTRAAGVPATITISGQRRALPSAVDRAAYRIVQEALTNVTRHAGDAAAVVHLEYGSDALTVRVDDDGRATPEQPSLPGVGLIGMRERVSALGGELLAGPRADGGFSVRVRLPVAEQA